MRRRPGAEKKKKIGQIMSNGILGKKMAGRADARPAESINCEYGRRAQFPTTYHTTESSPRARTIPGATCAGIVDTFGALYRVRNSRREIAAGDRKHVSARRVARALKRSQFQPFVRGNFALGLIDCGSEVLRHVALIDSPIQIE